MAADLVIRPATAGDTGQVLDLVKVSLGEGSIPRQGDYWRWKHEENPFGPSFCLLAEADGLLVGLRVFMRWTWRVKGVTVLAVRAVDTATHPEWRGQGIFSRLTLALLERMEEEGIAFVFNTPNRQSRPGYLKMGWVSLGRISFWVRPLRALTLIRSLPLWRDTGSTVSDPDWHAEGSSAQALLRQPGFSRFLDAMPEPRDRFFTPRRIEYFRWRYVAIPGFRYAAAWTLDGHDGAVIIFRGKSHGAFRELRLCEVLVGASAKSERMGRDLLRSVLNDGWANYVTGMAAMGTPEQHILLRCGFVPAPRLGPVMTVRPLKSIENGLDPLRRGDWHLSVGDLELF